MCPYRNEIWAVAKFPKDHAVVLAAGCAIPAYAQTHAKLIVKLLARISTKTSNVGDQLTAMVQAPEALSGAVVEGHVTKLRQPERGLGKGKPEIGVAR
ncbi:MAG: hypothetical protein ACRD7E_29875 [Bryobacteraceae bacterium]